MRMSVVHKLRLSGCVWQFDRVHIFDILRDHVFLRIGKPEVAYLALLQFHIFPLVVCTQTLLKVTRSAWTPHLFTTYPSSPWALWSFLILDATAPSIPANSSISCPSSVTNANRSAARYNKSLQRVYNFTVNHNNVCSHHCHQHTEEWILYRMCLWSITYYLFVIMSLKTPHRLQRQPW